MIAVLSDTNSYNTIIQKRLIVENGASSAPLGYCNYIETLFLKLSLMLLPILIVFVQKV